MEQIAQNAVVEKYEKIREGFLSIKNIWRPDNWSTVFPNSSNFISSTGTTFKTYKFEAENITYIYLSTNSNLLTDENSNKYIEPYVDLQGNIYAVFDVSDSASNPTTITFGGTTYNVVYSNIFDVEFNTEANISYYYLVSKKTSAYKKGDEILINPYVKDLTIYAIENTDPEAENPTSVSINGKTYTVDYTQTMEDLIALFNQKEQTDEYTKNSLTLASEAFTKDFATITKGINEKYKGQWNGYAILIILAMAITFLSSYFSQAGIRAKDAKGNVLKKQKPKPTMGIIMAFIMLFFTMSYTSAFALYIVTNSATSILLTYLTNVILNKIEDKKDKKNTVVADYVRK